MTTYKITGRVVYSDGTAVNAPSVSVYERTGLGADASKSVDLISYANGTFSASWMESGTRTPPWEVYVTVSDGTITLNSPLIYDLESAIDITLILDGENYRGLSEYDRIKSKVDPIIDPSTPKDVPADRIEWLARRADVFPTHLASYVQANRLADQRTVEPGTMYAFLRAGLPADLPKLLRAGEGPWERALRQAWARRILSLPGSGSAAEMDTKVAEEISAMRELLVESTTAMPPSGTTLSTIFDIAGLSLSDKQDFMTKWYDRTDLSSFWGEVNPSLADDFQFILQAATLTRNHAPLLTHLAGERGSTITAVSDLAAWSYQDWDDLLDNESIAIPADIPGANATEQRNNYARGLHRLVEDSYPTLSLRHRIAADEAGAGGPANTDELVQFFDDNPGFDITRTNIAKWVVDNSGAFANAVDPAVAREQLERTQRVYRLTPRIGRYDAAKVLLDNGIGSAADVVSRTREEFISEFEPLFTGGDHHDAGPLAGRIWDASSKIHGTTMGMISVYALGPSKVVPNALVGVGDYDLSQNGLPDLDGVLQTLDYCACQDCRSVFSPAAYLADLLHFLAERPSGVPNESALDKLGSVERRPDIVEILLDCDNTNTPLPYIDLVNEALEARFTGTLTAQNAKQTTWPAESLLLHPEHLDADIYAGNSPDPYITSMVYPLALPFSLSNLEARRYLEVAGVPLHDLLARLENPLGTLPDAWKAAALDLNDVQWQIISGDFQGNSSEDDREYWGYGAPDNNWYNILNGTANPGGDVGELLRRADITIDDLVELIDLTFIDPETYAVSGAIYISLDDSCQLSDAKVYNLDAPALVRMHRFIRLWRATRIPPRDLNVLIEDVGGTLNADCLADIAHIIGLQGQLDIPWDELATWWAPRMNARPHGKAYVLYEDSYLTAAHGSAEFADFLIDGEDYTTLAGEAGAPSLTEGHIKTILAATKLTRAEFDAIAAAGLAGSTFTFNNLTKYYATASAARALKVSVFELIDLIAITGASPFAGPLEARQFLDSIERVRDSGFSIDELNWVLRHPTELEDEFRDDDRVGATLGALALDLARIDAEVAELIDPEGVEIAANLASFLESPDVAEAMSILDGTNGEVDAVQGTFITTHFANFTDPTTAIANLVTDGGAITNIAERYTWLQREFVRSRRREALVVEQLAALTKLDRASCRALLFTVLTEPDGSLLLGQVFNSNFATQEQVDAKLTRALQPALFTAYDRLAKAALVVRRFRIRADHIDWYSDNIAWVNLDGLPLDDGDADVPFANWEALYKAARLRDLFPPEVNGLYEMSEAANLAAALAVLGEHTDWDVSSTTGLEYLGNQLSLEPSDFASGLTLAWMRPIVDASRKIGATIGQLHDWVSNSIDSTAVKQAIQSRFSAAKWAELARPLRDRIRIEQREALIGAVLATDSYASTRKALSDQLLIDLDMAPCMLTSRIKQAISSVQTFINRAMLGLEDDLAFDAEATERWEWMKNYRVWEANRKVFLYPENWIQPALRSNKTPLFEDLEGALSQAELDEENLETAIIHYAEGLDEIAKLEIISSYDTTSQFDADFGVMWVVARTQDTPRRYWIRSRERGTWSAWEQLPMPIQTDNVAVVVRGSHTYLFWLNREDCGDPTSEDTGRDFNYDRLTIAWSERRRDGWSDPRVSDPHVTPRLSAADAGNGKIPPNKYLLKTINTKPLVELRAYLVNDSKAAGFQFQRFLFDPSTKRARAVQGGVTWDVQNEMSFLDAYAIEGQRFTADTAFDQQLYNQNGDMVVTGTTFIQGVYKVNLFRQHNYRYQRAFVYQSDQWQILGSKKNTPAFFDDGEHKYMIEAEPISDNAGKDGTKVTPTQPGSTDTNPFFGIINFENDVPADSDVPMIGIQMIKDGVQPHQPWANLSPGVQPSLFQFYNFVDNAYIPQGQGSKVLEDAEGQANGNPGVFDSNPEGPPPDPTAVRLRLTTFHHPFAPQIVSRLNLKGVSGIYNTREVGLLRQSHIDTPLDSAGLDADPVVVRTPIPVDEFDFSTGGTYSMYNWELFFHVPMLVADKLSASHRFEDAQRWYHAIFNPLDPIEDQSGTGARYWRVKPLYEAALAGEQDQLQAMLGIGVDDDEQVKALADFNDQVEAWLDNPFEPHVVAQLRPGAYMRATFMKYLDNLIAWADQLFRRDSIESINEATILYKLVVELLGERPNKLPAFESEAKTYTELSSGLDAFSNAAVALENWVYVPPGNPSLLVDGEFEPAGWKKVPMRFWYFCYPPNYKLLEYWDIVDDRLWKIRHCQNIDGITRQLPLFQPPIDPALLVAATAAGIDLSSVLGELGAGLPPYRFRYVLAKAMDFCGDLRALGGALLSAFEKRDAEKLARLRSGHESALLDASREIRVQRIDEIQARIDSLQQTAGAIAHRKKYYDDLYEENVSLEEKTQQELLALALESSVMTTGIQSLASFLGLIPQFEIGTGFFNNYGGSQVSSGVRGFAEMSSMTTTGLNYLAQKYGTDAQHLRRRAEWKFQVEQADFEAKRVERELVASRIQLEIAKRELSNHDLSVKQAREVDEHLHDKYSNTELYDWMAEEIAKVYFQAYELAFDVAKRAEAAYRHELAIDAAEPRIVQFGYWDSVHDGLLAGERLTKDLRRLEKAYMDRDVREYELRKNVSLAHINPLALSVLQETGTCSFKVPEVLFDLDHPGHLLRRIRSVSLTIPAVVGPHTSLGARLQLTGHKIRKSTSGNLESVYGGQDMIATSTAMSDSGLFNLDFRDERYLPFEYAGAADSEWTLTLPSAVRQFDYRTISDVVISISYTARDGGDGFRGDVEMDLATNFNGATWGNNVNDAVHMIVVHDAFPNEWAAFLNPESAAMSQTLTLPVTAEHFPYFARNSGPDVDGIDLILLLADGVTTDALEVSFNYGPVDKELEQSGNTMTFSTGTIDPAVPPATWTLSRDKGASPSGIVSDEWLDPEKVLGLLLLVHYKL